jgi:anion-transporting  ArsA/GET3 family ATPase
MNNELKLTITRSYSRKKNLGNYESEDYFACYSQEFDSLDIEDEEMRGASRELYMKARKDVEDEINRKEEKREVEADVNEIIERTRAGNSITVDEYEKVVYAGEAIALNEAKKAYKRSPEYKAQVESRKGKHQ